MLGDSWVHVCILLLSGVKRHMLRGPWVGLFEANEWGVLRHAGLRRVEYGLGPIIVEADLSHLCCSDPFPVPGEQQLLFLGCIACFFHSWCSPHAQGRCALSCEWGRGPHRAGLSGTAVSVRSVSCVAPVSHS